MILLGLSEHDSCFKTKISIRRDGLETQVVLDEGFCLDVQSHKPWRDIGLDYEAISFVPQKSSFQTYFSVLENIYQIQSHLAVVQNKLYTFHGILLIVLKNMCRDGVSTLQ